MLKEQLIEQLGTMEIAKILFTFQTLFLPLTSYVACYAPPS